MATHEDHFRKYNECGYVIVLSNFRLHMRWLLINIFLCLLLLMRGFSVEARKHKGVTTIEQMPQFPGGNSKLHEFINTYTKYPPQALKEQIEGRVTVAFVVGVDGSISGIKVARGVRKDMDEEAVRLIDSMPCWEPGKLNGIKVAVHFNLPIKFILD